MLSDSTTWPWLPTTLPDGSYAAQPKTVIPYMVNYSALFLTLLLLCVVCCCGGMFRLWVVKRRAAGGATKAPSKGDEKEEGGNWVPSF